MFLRATRRNIPEGGIVNRCISANRTQNSTRSQMRIPKKWSKILCYEFEALCSNSSLSISI
jgi:hypothetical protein